MIDIENLERDLAQVRRRAPLIHNLTNYVVMNNTANALLALGASPVMAHAREEVEEMASIASAVVLNIGTLEPAWVEAMLLAGSKGRQRGIPVVFDPVGAGATTYRNTACDQILRTCHPTIIRGNASEIMALAGVGVHTKGVDSTAASDAALAAAHRLAGATEAIVVISGPTDYITDGTRTETVRNGHPMMARTTGLGCTATAVVAAFAAVNADPFEAALHGMAVMGIAGEIAAVRSRGNGSLQLHFLDELFGLDGETIRKHIRL